MEVVAEKSLRIDKYLSECTKYSRSTIQKMIESEFIKVNGKKSESVGSSKEFP